MPTLMIIILFVLMKIKKKIIIYEYNGLHGHSTLTTYIIFVPTLVLLKKVFLKVFYHTLAYRSSWKGGMDHLYKSSKFSRRLYMKFGFDWPSGSEVKIFENG